MGRLNRSKKPREFFAALNNSITQSGRELPVVDGDLNPEFTGCFSLRQPIRLRNRVVENRLLEAQKWAALAQIGADSLENAWWQLHYVQFHDVFTGSHPTAIFHEVLALLDEIESAANAVLESAFAQLAPEKSARGVVVFNGLPWTRRDIVELALPDGWEGVSSIQNPNGAVLPFEVRDGYARVEVEIPAVGYAGFSLESGPPSVDNWRKVETAKLENEQIRLEFNTEDGISRLVWKKSGKVLLENAGSWLVLQSDAGNFQIENPNGAEVPASLGSMELETRSSPLGQTVRLSGEFPALEWMKNGVLRYSADWFLPQHSAAIELKLGLDWHGEAARVRLTLPTTLDTSTGIFEIPFGVVSRKPYSPRTNAKGEWPAHRFVTLESDGHGLALVNTGVAGVEVNGGTLSTTLLRAPASVYAGMTLDGTASGHGHHLFEFSILPYFGSWADAQVVQIAQQRNTPILAHFGAFSACDSRLQLEPANVVLSSVQAASDGCGETLVRVYETAGRATEAVLKFGGASEVCECDLAQNRGEKISISGGELVFKIQPFEIKTFRVQMSRQGATPQNSRRRISNLRL